MPVAPPGDAPAIRTAHLGSRSCAVCPAATPAALRTVRLALPTTYWLEGMRRALLGPTEFSPALAGWGHAHLLPALLAGTEVLTAAAHGWFRRSERRAWQLGRYDQVTGY